MVYVLPRASSMLKDFEGLAVMGMRKRDGLVGQTGRLYTF